MKIHFNKRVVLYFCLATLTLLGLGVFTFMSTQRLISTARLISQALRVINKGEEILKAVVDKETATHGYIITQDSAFLAPYLSASKSLPRLMQQMDSLTQGSTHQTLHIENLNRLIQRKLTIMERNIGVGSVNFEKARSLIKAGDGKRVMDSIRFAIKAIQDEERTFFRARNTLSAGQFQVFQYAVGGLITVVALVIGLLFYVINRQLQVRNSTEADLRKAGAEIRDLYDQAPCGYFSVKADIFFSNVNQTLLNWMGFKREEVIGKMKFEDLLSPQSKEKFLAGFEADFARYKTDGAVNDLEFDFVRKDGSTFPVIVNSIAVFDAAGNFVESRSTVFDHSERKKIEEQLESANKELEAFSYSVSHDLRAPLRSVNGYAKMLEEDYNVLLDDNGKRLIGIIRDNALHMGQLIDNLLAFSRLGRKEIQKESINMEDLVQTVIEEVSIEHPQVQFKINNLHAIAADKSLLKQVWFNYISNAVKYSSKVENPLIQIKSQRINQEVIYSVSDNGTGFNMDYVHKLFRVFQRLHTHEEFEGTGVGLAIVNRIITKHGGRVWAESQPGKGANFHFSLPDDVANRNLN